MLLHISLSDLQLFSLKLFWIETERFLGQYTSTTASHLMIELTISNQYAINSLKKILIC